MTVGALTRQAHEVPWQGVALYGALSLGLAWVAAVPLWLGEGLNDPAAPLWTVVMTSMPALVAVLVTVTRSPRSGWTASLGIASAMPWRRTVLISALAAAATMAFSAAAIALAAVTGVVTLRPQLTAASALALVAMTLVFGLIAVGEELGWRGYLHTALRPLGPVRMLLLSGSLWGVWHAPLLLLGSNYGTNSPLSIPLMVISTVLLGVLLAWLRERTGTVWAAATAHGALNASITLIIPAFVAPDQVRPGLTLLGWPGWVVMAIAVAVLAMAGQLRWGEPSPARPRGQRLKRANHRSRGASSAEHLNRLPRPVNHGLWDAPLRGARLPARRRVSTAVPPAADAASETTGT